VTVTLETNVSCPTCQHKIRYIAIATVRVNKRSLRTVPRNVTLGFFEHATCPGCGTDLPRDKPLDREPYRVAEKDAAKVAEYRRKKWGVEDEGVNVERVAGSETAATEEAG
jgi:endogenous inhibitor of DNA gyrase (YacG/DUF329 family)